MTTYPRAHRLIFSIFAALFIVSSFSAQSEELPILNEGDVQREYLRARGIQVAEGDEKAVPAEQNCRGLALMIFRYRDTLSNDQDSLGAKELINNAAQLDVTTQIYMHMGCRPERLMSRDLYVSAENKTYHAGSGSK